MNSLFFFLPPEIRVDCCELLSRMVVWEIPEQRRKSHNFNSLSFENIEFQVRTKRSNKRSFKNNNFHFNCRKFGCLVVSRDLQSGELTKVSNFFGQFVYLIGILGVFFCNTFILLEIDFVLLLICIILQLLTICRKCKKSNYIIYNVNTFW